MAKSPTTPTRVSADIAVTAASVALAENRSASEQINYWARIGMHIERSGSVDMRRVLSVASGASQFSLLTEQERNTAHAVIDARIAERVANQRFGYDLRAAGHTTVSIDDEGLLIEISADGRRHRL